MVPGRCPSSRAIDQRFFNTYLELEPLSEETAQIRALVSSYEIRRTEAVASQEKVNIRKAHDHASGMTARFFRDMGALAVGLTGVVGGVLWWLDASKTESNISGGGFPTGHDIASAADSVRT